MSFKKTNSPGGWWNSCTSWFCSSTSKEETETKSSNEWWSWFYSSIPSAPKGIMKPLIMSLLLKCASGANFNSTVNENAWDSFWNNISVWGLLALISGSTIFSAGACVTCCSVYCAICCIYKHLTDSDVRSEHKEMCDETKNFFEKLCCCKIGDEEEFTPINSAP